MNRLVLILLLLTHSVFALTPEQKAELIEKVRQSKNEKRVALEGRIAQHKQAKALHRPHLIKHERLRLLRQDERLRNYKPIRHSR
ncbi:MAG: hypothetical protein JXK05_07175 [Campylobacterales bacterium]|nr:hypothetical protein [Campylobacterales bacterium]